MKEKNGLETLNSLTHVEQLRNLIQETTKQDACDVTSTKYSADLWKSLAKTFKNHFKNGGKGFRIKNLELS